MKISRSLLIQTALLFVAVAFSLLSADHLPDVVPSHWNAAGQVDAYGSKWTNLFLMPGVLVFIALLTVAVPKLSPEKFEIEPFEATYSWVMVFVSALMLAIHLVIVEMSMGAKWDVTKLMMGILFASFIPIGNLMGKIKPNFYMGVRTPWTLADERVWTSTHRFAGRLYVFGSVLGLLLVVLGLSFWLTFSYFMLMCLAPVVQSYLVYNRLHADKGGLSHE